jgi:hypothetical protein
MCKKKIRGRTAWIVTRHWIAEYPRCEVAAIFSGRLGGVRVRELVEVLYVTGGAFTLLSSSGSGWVAQDASAIILAAVAAMPNNLTCLNEPSIVQRRLLLAAMT